MCEGFTQECILAVAGLEVRIPSTAVERQYLCTNSCTNHLFGLFTHIYTSAPGMKTTRAVQQTLVNSGKCHYILYCTRDMNYYSKW